MKSIKITVFENNEYILAMLKGYCYANNLTIAAVDFNKDVICVLEKLKPDLVIVPLEMLCASEKSFEVSLLRQMTGLGQAKICALKKSSVSINAQQLSWVDVIITDPFDLRELDHYIKTHFFDGSYPKDNRSNVERRSTINRRTSDFLRRGDDYCQEALGAQVPLKPGHVAYKDEDFIIDQRKKCLYLNGHKVHLTPKEFELIELLITDIDRVFSSGEIINHLWPDNKRATKSDLYQYMHLLRKKIETDIHNPQWVMTVKGFGYKLNLDSSNNNYRINMHDQADLEPIGRDVFQAA